MSEEALDEVFAVAGGAIEVPGLRAAEISRRARATRTRRRRRVSTVLGAALFVVTVGTALSVRGSGSGEPVLDTPSVVAVDNPAPAAWWANDVLYLHHAAVGLPRVSDLVDLGDGAVIGDEAGAVVLVSPGGRLTPIGHKVADAPLVASPERGLVAWVDPRESRPRLVIYDAVTHEVRATLTLPADGPRRDELAAGSHPIALDRETLYFADLQGDWRLRPPYDSPEKVDAGGLVDVASAVVLRQVDDRTLDVVQPFFSVDHLLRGSTGARLSPDGNYVLTQLGTPGQGSMKTVRIYDARSGDRVWTGLRSGDQVLATSVGADDLATYVVAHRADQPAAGEYVRMSYTGPYELRTCHLAVHTCTRVVRFPHTGALPVLAQ